MDKEMVFHELMERMEKDKCPICEFMDFRLNQAMERFIEEGVNSPHLRYKIEKSNGFCAYHAQKLSLLRDPLTHAILYHDFMHNVIENINDKKNKIDYSNHNNCFFCENVKTNEKDYTSAFIEFYSNEKFKSAYEKNGTLCVRHLTIIKNIRMKNKSDFQELMATTLEKYKKLNENLSEIKRKSDYRYTDELWTEEEKEAWLKAVGIFNGTVII